MIVLRPCLDCGTPSPLSRCPAHQRTTSQRGYGAEHQRERKAALSGAECERCSCTVELQRDHVDPTLTGAAREAGANKRWLCDCAAHRCHSRYGDRRGRGENFGALRRADVAAFWRKKAANDADDSPMRVI